MAVAKKPPAQPPDRASEQAPRNARSEEPSLGADQADFDDDDEVGPQGGYGGTGSDQSRPKR